MQELKMLWEAGCSLIPLGSPDEPPPIWFQQRMGKASRTEMMLQWAKTPIFAWKKYQDKKPTDTELTRWAQQYPRANWAVLTGIVVNVVDCDNQDAIDYVESGAITKTPISVKTGNGRHYYYRVDESVSVVNYAGNGLDLRGAGGYVVAPGSKHASGTIYTLEMEPGASFESLPSLTADDLARIKSFKKVGEISLELPLVQQEHEKRQGEISFTLPEAGEQNSHQPQKAPQSPQDAISAPFIAEPPKPTLETKAEPGERNNTLASIAGRLFFEGRVFSETLGECLRWNRENPAPMDDQEVIQTTYSIYKTHNSKHPTNKVALFPKIIQPEAFELDASAKPVFPAKLLDLQPGALKEIFDYINETATLQQPIFALNASILAVGVMSRRMFCSPTGLRLNEMIISLGHTGCGKDHARKAVKALLRKNGYESSIGGDSFSSGQGLMARVAAVPNVLFCLDEIGLMLESVTKHNAASHEVQILKRLMELYTSSGGWVHGAEYADLQNRPRQDIECPHAFIYGTSTPESFWSAMQSRNVLEGFVSRMLITESDIIRSDFRIPDRKLEDAPDLTGWVRELLGQVDIGQTMMMQPRVIPFTKGALQLLDKFERTKTKPACESLDVINAALYTRAQEHIIKLACINALASCRTDKLIVDEKEIEWATLFTEYSMRLIAHHARETMAENPFEQRMKDLLREIRKTGARGMSENQFRRGFSKWGKERDEIRKALIEGGYIALSECYSTRGKKRLALVAIKNCTDDE